MGKISEEGNDHPPAFPTSPNRGRGFAFFLFFLITAATRSFGQGTATPRNLHDLHLTDDDYALRYRALEEQKPIRKQFDWRTLPRYEALQAKVNSLVTSSRLTVLRQPVNVLQRPSTNFILSGDIDGSVFSECYDFCQYVGRVFIRVKVPMLAPTVPSGTALEYLGLRTYTTVLGSPETIPDFRQVDLQHSYPLAWKAMNELANFKPNSQEEDTIIGPFESRQEVEVASWLLQVLRLQEWYLQARFQAARQVQAGLIDMDARERPEDIQASDLCGDYSHGYLSRTEPCGKVKGQTGWIRLCGQGQFDLYPCPQLHISPSLMNSMQSALDDYEKATATLRDNTISAEKGLASSVKLGSVAWGALGWYGDMPDYTAAWIDMNLRGCLNPKYNNASRRTQGDLTAAEQTVFFAEEVQCWATRYEIPPGSRVVGRVVEPLWWQSYLKQRATGIVPAN